MPKFNFQKIVRPLAGALLLFLFAFGGNSPALAIEPDGFQRDPCEGESCFNAPDADEIDPAIDTEKTLREQVLTIINYFLSFLGLAAVIVIIYGGFLWIFSGGEEENVTKGRKIVLYAGAGIILILLSFALVRFFIDSGKGPQTPGGQNPPVGPTNPGFPPNGTVVTTTSNGFTVTIAGGPVSGSAPLKIELSGLRSRYPGQDQTIPDGAFHWSYVARNGAKVDLGSGHTVTHTLTEVGRFVFTLRIDPRPEGPEKEAGVGTFAIEVLPPGAEVNFTINGKDAKLFQQFSTTEGGKGITFVPSAPVASSTVRAIETYTWNFGDGTPLLRTATPEAVTHIFPRTGTFTVTLSGVDALGSVRSRQVVIGIADIVARIETSPLEKFVGAEITFNAANSESSFGEITETFWTIIAPDGEKEEVKTESFTKTFSESGNIQVTLSVRDSSGKTGVASEIIPIRSHPPRANFDFEPRSSSEPSVFVFDATTSSDLDADALTYSWDFQNDGEFEISENTSARAEFTFDEEGAYNVKLRVQDESGEISEVTRKVEVESVLNVDFTADRFIAHPGEEITFAAESENALRFLWDFGDESTTQGNEGSVAHTFLEKGRYEVTLTVFDNEDHENSRKRTVLIGEKDMPVAAFEVKIEDFIRLPEKNVCEGKDGIRISRADMVTFDASASINRDGQKSNLEYEWVFHDGVLFRDQMIRRRFDEIAEDADCFPVKLTVRDKNTGKKSEAAPFWIKIENAAPRLDGLLVTIPENRVTPVIVPLKVQNPRDPDGQIVEYKWWAFRDGDSEKIGLHTTTIPSTSIILPVHGQEKEVNRYYFAVEVKDNFGKKVNSEEIFGQSSFVEVINGENRSPIVDFRVEKTTVAEGDTITFFAEALDPLGGTIPDSGFMWDFNGDSIFDAVGTGPQVTHRFESPGEFDVRLKVVHRGLASSKSRRVFVERKHQLPKAAFTFVIQGHNVLFNAGTSAVDTAIPNNFPSFAWDLDLNFDTDGDGQKDNDVDSTAARLTHFYQTFGTRSVKLTVTDRLGVKDQVVREVAVVGSGRVMGGTGTGSATDRENLENIRESIRLRSSHPLTTLDLVLERSTIRSGEKMALLIFVKNANNTLFDGTVELRVISGTADLSSGAIQIVRGEGRAEVTGTAKGKIVLQALAKNTISGDVSEEIFFTVE